MKRFTDQVVVITGAANGIGEACALRFAEEGAKVACLDVAEAANEATAVTCRNLGVEAVALPCLDGRKNKLAGLGRIFRFQERRDWFDALGGDGIGSLRRDGQRRLPWQHADGHGARCGG